jgi:hypothetical protein
MKRLMLIFILIAIVLSPARASDGILPVERLIVNSPVECGAAWDGAGVLLDSHCGPYADHVVIPDNVMFAIVGTGVVTHNHPDGTCWTFSPGDLKFAAAAYLKESRVVAHRLGVVTVSILRSTANIWKIPDGEIDAEARRQLVLMPDDPTGCDYLAATWSALAARYGFEFQVIHD